VADWSIASDGGVLDDVIFEVSVIILDQIFRLVFQIDSIERLVLGIGVHLTTRTRACLTCDLLQSSQHVQLLDALIMLESCLFFATFIDRNRLE